jgi:hypothetical protein
VITHIIQLGLLQRSAESSLVALVSGVSPQLTGEADFWHPTGIDVVRAATAEALGDEPADLAYRVGRSPG